VIENENGGSIDAVIDMSNENYQNELLSLFKSLAVPPVILNKDDHIGTFNELSKRGSRRCIYISDKIEEEKLREIAQAGINKLDNILLVDEETKDLIADKKGLSAFNHVLSCTQQHVPHLQIMSTVRKIREQKFFGIDKTVSYGAYIHRYVLSHSDQRQWFRDSLFEFVKGLATILNRPTDSFAQFAVEVQEELLMNAIWDANPKLKAVDRRIPVALLPQETVQVEWSFDGTHLAIGVKDPFGTFEHNVVYKYLKFLYTTDKRALIRMQQNDAGAGLGLFMVLERLSALVINLSYSQATEVIALLNLTGSPRAMAKKQRSFQFFSI